MTVMRTLKGLAGVAAIAASVSCGDVVRQGRSPVYLVINSLQASAGGGTSGTLAGTLQSDVLTNVTSPAPCTTEAPCATIFSDNGEVSLRLSLRDLGTATDPTTPSLNNEVTITRYRVVYRRADGRNTPGVDVPYPFDAAVTVTVGADGASSGFQLVRNAAKQEAPLRALATNPDIISTIADVTFYGHDQAGNDVSATGSITVDFGNFGDPQ